MNADNVELWNQYVDKLAKAAGMRISTLDQLVEALDKRHAYFHSMGCRLSDHGLDTAYAEEFKPAEVKKIFAALRAGRAQDKAKLAVFKSAMMLEFGKMDHVRGWTQQLHLGALRNNNSRFFAKIGPDTGFDSIDDLNMARPLSRFLDALDRTGQLPKTILYNLNPRDNAMLAAMIGNFQDGSVAGKMQFGSGWWFLDQKDGMTNQMNALSSLGLLSRFVGMLTDSRSFLSFPRHEYFRRILCDLLGKDMEAGEIPMDMKLIGGMVQDISFRNARNYFGIAVRD
jgi:glucuronate isomerase